MRGGLGGGVGCSGGLCGRGRRCGKVLVVGFAGTSTYVFLAWSQSMVHGGLYHIELTE